MKYFSMIVLALAITGFSLSAAPVCPTTTYTNSDCGYLLTIGPGGAVTGAPVPGADPYDGSDDALVGVINNSGASYTGSIILSGSGDGGGIFAFESDGICAYSSASYCSTAASSYEGPLNTFSGINADGTSGSVDITGLADGAATYFSLEGSPASLGGGIIVGSPEPASIAMLGAGLVGLYWVGRRRKA